METEPLDPETQDALSTLSRYLADSAPPLEAMEGITELLARPAELTAAQINTWARGQYQGRGGGALLSDYLFHALKKLRIMADLQLISKEAMERFLLSLKAPLLHFCPPGERAILEQNLAALAESDSLLSGPAHVVPVNIESRTGSAVQAGTGYAAEILRRNPDLAFLLDRLARGPVPADSEHPRIAQESVPHIFAAAARSAQNGTELDEISDALQVLGAGVHSGQMFKTLGQGLPDWRYAAEPGEETAPSPIAQSHLVEAMRHIISLAQNTRVGAKRFQELIDAAVEQFNRGALPRAVAMIEIAENVVRDGQVDAQTANYARSIGHESLDDDRLRGYAENPADHSMLARFLSFFDAMRPAALLGRLDGEPRRHQRRLLLSLLEVHGESARAEALKLLGVSVESGVYRSEWYFPRNLVYLLHRIPPRDHTPSEEEIRLVARLLDPTCALSLTKEALTHLGEIRQASSERALAGFLDRTEQLLRSHGPYPQDPGTLRSLLDRIVLVLARLGTPGSFRAVINHAFQRQAALGDTMARLAYLSGQDLSADPESLEKIMAAFRDALPRKILGITVQKDSPEIVPIVKSLSSTPTEAVRQLLNETAGKYPDRDFGQAAAAVLEEMTREKQAAGGASGKVMGDLQLFGLADLLQQLARTRATGTLTLSDKSGRTLGTITLDRGGLLDCRSGHLLDDDGLFRLFEVPAPGTFVFAGVPPGETTGTASTRPPRDLEPLIREGIRRYDEFQWLRALLPDATPLKPTGRSPEFAPGGEDSELCRDVWHKASQGMFPEEVESSVTADPVRIRRLLVCWVEAGYLA